MRGSNPVAERPEVEYCRRRPARRRHPETQTDCEGSDIMAARELNARVAALEAEVSRLKERLERGDKTSKHWVDTVYGAFANDPDFLEAMRLGRKYRESLRPRLAATPVNRTVKRRNR